MLAFQSVRRKIIAPALSPPKARVLICVRQRCHRAGHSPYLIATLHSSSCSFFDASIWPRTKPAPPWARMLEAKAPRARSVLGSSSGETASIGSPVCGWKQINKYPEQCSCSILSISFMVRSALVMGVSLCFTSIPHFVEVLPFKLS